MLQQCIDFCLRCPYHIRSKGFTCRRSFIWLCRYEAVKDSNEWSTLVTTFEKQNIIRQRKTIPLMVGNGKMENWKTTRDSSITHCKAFGFSRLGTKLLKFFCNISSNCPKSTVPNRYIKNSLDTSPTMRRQRYCSLDLLLYHRSSLSFVLYVLQINFTNLM